MFGSPKRQASEADAILVWASPTRQERARLIKRVTPKFAWLDSEVWEKEWWCSVFWEDEPYIWLVETNQMTKGNYSGYFPWVHFLFIVSFLTDSVVVVWCFSTNSGPGDHITPSREVGYKKGVTHYLTFIACSLPWNTEEWLIWKTSRLVDGCWLKCNGAPCFLQNALSPTTRAEWHAWDPTVTEMCRDRMAANTRRWPAMESSGQVKPVSQDKLLSPLPSTLGPLIVR